MTNEEAVDKLAHDAANLAYACSLLFSTYPHNVQAAALMDMYGKLLSNVQPHVREMVTLWHSKAALRIAGVIDEIEGRNHAGDKAH